MSNLPLANKTILVTRAKEQAKELSDLIEDKGGTAIEVPLLSFEATTDTEQVKRAIHTINDFEWLVFTSANGVRLFMEQYSKRFRHKPCCRIAVVGEKTEMALNDFGLHADLVPKNYVAEALVEDLKGKIRKGDRILVARGNLGRPILIDELQAAGAEVTDLTVYKTVRDEQAYSALWQAFEDHKIDYVTFTSSSTVKHFVAAVDKLQLQKHHPTIACIGPIAEETATRLGLTVDVVPNVYTIEGLIDEIISHVKGGR